MRLAFPLVLALVAGSGCEPNIAVPKAGKTSVALFDPLATPPVLPTPNDLAFTGGDGVHLNVPDEPGQLPAQLALNAYLRSLNGFPPSSTVSAAFSAGLDPKSVTLETATAAGSIVLVDASIAAPPAGLVASLSSDGKTVNVASTARFTSGHRYAVLVFGGSDAAGLQLAGGGGQVVASPTFFFLRSPTPLLQRCDNAADPTCVCPASAIADATDTTCHSATQALTDAQARTAEPQRAQLDAAINQLMPLVAPKRSRDDLVLFFTFTITTQPVAEFDPTSGALPFPNDALINQTTGLVTLPIATGDPEAPLKMQLNTLDGFSVSAPATVTVDSAAGANLDAASLQPGRTTLLLNIGGTEPPSFTATPSFGQVALTPILPLQGDQIRYAAVVTRGATAGGQALVPAPATVLLLQPNPLFDGVHSTVTVLDDASAQQLETLRLALAPLLGILESQGVQPANIAALWTFTTQSIARPLQALDAYPTQKTIVTDVTATAYTDFTALPAGLKPFVADVKAVVLGTFTTQLVYDPTTRVVNFTRTPSPSTPTIVQNDRFAAAPASVLPATIHYWLTLPKTTAAATGAPLVIAQHGLTSWRGDMFTLGEDLAKGGSATIGFDIDFHGARTQCSADNQCIGGLAGNCNTTTGVCAAGLAPNTTNPLACDLAAFSGDTANDCEPAASGNGYVDPSNLFGARAGGYQYVVDAAQLVRVVTATGGNSLQAKLTASGLGAVTIDPSHLSFIGHSLGSINGSVFLAVDPSINGANVLSVGGGHVFEILSDGDFHPAVDGLLAALGIMRGTAAYAQLVQTARWVLDPIDPFSVARMIHRAPAFSYVFAATNLPKLAIVQEAGLDTTVPPQYEEALSQSLWGPSGLDAAGHAQGADAAGALASTYFADDVHASLLTAMPSASMRTQAITYVLTDGVTLPTATP